jgi:hypothetical protein
MSEEFRTVPVHKEDLKFDWYKSGTISRANYKFDDLFGFEFGWRRKYENNIGTGFGILVGICHDDYGRNYTNAQGTNRRGYGAALTFSGIDIQGPITLSGLNPFYPYSLVPKVFLDLPLTNNGKGLFISLSASYELLEAVNGWDRYDSYQVNDFKVLAHIFPIGMSLNFNRIEVGGQYMLNFKTKTGNDFGAKIETFGFFVIISTRTVL